MRKYNSLLSTIETNFSAESGASPESLVHFMGRLKENPTWRESLMSELITSLDDQEFSWREALWSDDCHVVQTDSEAQARSFVVENISSRMTECERRG